MSGLFCPLLKKNCIEHQCKFYVHLLGNDPQTGKGIDKFDCALAFIPVLLIEGAQQTRQAGAAIESFRNEMVKGNAQTLIALTSQGHTSQLLPEAFDPVDKRGRDNEADNHPR